MRSKQELETAIHRDRCAALVVNAHSRRGRHLYESARQGLERGGFRVVGAFPVDRPDELETSLAAATSRGPDLLVVGGGDGTIGAGARHLAHRDVALGLLPLGTTNNFGRSLGIPLDLEGAVGLLLTGKVVDVDLGLAGGLPFANHVGIGLSADIAARAPRRLKRIAGRYAYPVTALALLVRHGPVRATITAHGARHTFRTHQLYVANGGFHAGRPITADTDADDKLLVVYPVGGPGRRDLLRATARNASTGHRRTIRQEPFLAVDELLLETEPSAAVEVDGELHGRTPMRISLDANALRVVAGQDFEDR